MLSKRRASARVSGAVYSMNSNPSVPAGLCCAASMRLRSLQGMYKQKGPAVLAGPYAKRVRRRLRLEEFFHFIHPRLRAGVVALGVAAADGFELLEKLFLPRREVDRRLDDHVTQEIAMRVRAHALDTFAAQPEDFSA